MEDLLQRITINPNIAFGKPTIRGLRYSVEWLLELLCSGMSQQEILDDYEDLEAADIYAALAYAVKLAQISSCAMSWTLTSKMRRRRPMSHHRVAFE